MDRHARFIPAEAAFVRREPLRAVNKALDAGPVRTTLRKAGTAVCTVACPDLVYLFAARQMRDELTPKARLGLYEALRIAEIDRVAKPYAEAHPKTGRPYPPTTFKRAVRELGLEALDEVLDGPD